jgi:hypothetical protein
VGTMFRKDWFIHSIVVGGYTYTQTAMLIISLHLILLNMESSLKMIQITK